MANIRKIAKLAGVSTATVSRILNKDETFSVSDSTKERVLETVKRLNYKLNSSSGTDNIDKLHIGVINCLSSEEELKDPYFREIKIGIEEQAEFWGMTLEKEFRFPKAKFNWQDFSIYGAVIVIGSLMESVLADIYKYNHNIIIVDEQRHFKN
ncbi:LacI family DNA-binding transcriptional regulator, partial [Lactobacillus sp. XV13L]|nr:LacI family DNA-binding transcriptional regulator [Lactobacillus sp. XV13L]